MAILSESFLLLSICGLWKPNTWSGWKSIIFYLYAIFVFFLHNGFVLAEILDLFLSVSTADERIDTIVTLISMLAVTAKMVGIYATRNDILGVCARFDSEWHAPNPDEIQILQTCNNDFRLYFIVYTSMFEMAVSGNTLGRLRADTPDFTLPFKIYVPYDYCSPGVFRLTVLFEFLAVLVASNIEAAFDTLFRGVMVQICARIQMLKRRFEVSIESLQKMRNDKSSDPREYQSMEQELFSDWIKKHNAILKLSDDIESVFSKVIFVQYYLSSFVVCTTVYILSQTPFGPPFLGIGGYLFVMTSEIFMICYSANQVTLEFADLSVAMYNTNWFVLSIPAKRYIVIMMTRTLRPIVFTSGHLVTLSLESFKSLMKVTYSIYNVLKN